MTETLQRVNLVINRTSAIDGVRQALAAEDYEGAARFVQRFYELADAVEPETAGPPSTPQAEEQEKVRCLTCRDRSIRRSSGSQHARQTLASCWQQQASFCQTEAAAEAGLHPRVLIVYQ